MHIIILIINYMGIGMGLAITGGTTVEAFEAAYRDAIFSDEARVVMGKRVIAAENYTLLAYLFGDRDDGGKGWNANVGSGGLLHAVVEHSMEAGANLAACVGMARVLVEHGANTRAVDAAGNTALFVWASKQDIIQGRGFDRYYFVLAELLLDGKAVCAANGDTVLHELAKRCYLPMISWAFSPSVSLDVAATNAQGHHALQRALDCGHERSNPMSITFFRQALVRAQVQLERGTPVGADSSTDSLVPPKPPRRVQSMGAPFPPPPEELGDSSPPPPPPRRRAGTTVACAEAEVLAVLDLYRGKGEGE